MEDKSHQVAPSLLRNCCCCITIQNKTLLWLIQNKSIMYWNRLNLPVSISENLKLAHIWMWAEGCSEASKSPSSGLRNWRVTNDLHVFCAPGPALVLVLVLVLVPLPVDTVSLRHSAKHAHNHADKHAHTRTRTDALLTDAVGVRQVLCSQGQNFRSELSN